MVELMLCGFSKIYEEIKDYIYRNGKMYEEAGEESAEFLINLLGLNDTYIASYEEITYAN